MQSDDLHSVLSAGLQSIDHSGLSIASGSRNQLPLTLLRTGIQDPVR